MTTAASGPLMLPLEYLRNALADSAAFRTWVGTAGANIQEQARNRIHYESLSPPPASGDVYTLVELQSLRPFAMLWMNQEDGFQSVRDAAAGGDEWAHSGRLFMWFEQDILEAIQGDAAEIYVRFMNQIGSFITEMQDAAAAAGSGATRYLVWNTLNIVMGPIRSELDELVLQGDYMRMIMSVDWRGVGS